MAKLFFQIDKDKFQTIVKNCYKNSAKTSESVLGVLHIVKVKGESKLKLVTTDGNRLCVMTLDELDILEETGNLKPITIDLEKLSKISFFKFKKGLLHLLQITIDDENGMTISDPMADITYKVKLISGQYLKFEQFIDKKYYQRKTRQSVYVNCDLLCQVLQSTARNFRSQIVELNFDKKDNLAKIYISGKDPDDKFSTTTILMPIQIRGNEDFHNGNI